MTDLDKWFDTWFRDPPPKAREQLLKLVRKEYEKGYMAGLSKIYHEYNYFENREDINEKFEAFAKRKRKELTNKEKR